MRTPQEDIKYLADSANRVSVLAYLDEGPSDRQRLHDDLDIPQSTLGRVLNGLEDRGWIEREGRECRLTEFGRQLIADFKGLERRIETNQKLRLINSWLPIEELGLDLQGFSEAIITTPTATDPMAPWSRAELIPHTATNLQILASVMIQQVLSRIAARTRTGELTVEAVITGDIIELMLANPDSTELVRQILESEHGALYRYPGTFPESMAVVDDSSVAYAVFDEEGRFVALVECDDRDLVDMSIERFETLKAESDRLSIRHFQG